MSNDAVKSSRTPDRSSGKDDVRGRYRNNRGNNNSRSREISPSRKIFNNNNNNNNDNNTRISRNGDSYIPSASKRLHIDKSEIEESQKNFNDIYWPSLIDVGTNSWIFSIPDILHTTPSRLEGIPLEDEIARRYKGILFILKVTRDLNLFHVTIYTSCVYFHRFFMRRSFKHYHHYEVAAAAIFLACKVQENRRGYKELIIPVARHSSKNMNLVVDSNTKEYWKWKETIDRLEEKLMEVLCFDIMLKSPYELTKNYASYLPTIIGDNQILKTEIMTSITGFMEESIKFGCFLRFEIGKIYLSGIIYTSIILKHPEILPKKSDFSKFNTTIQELYETYKFLITISSTLKDLHQALLKKYPNFTEEQFIDYYNKNSTKKDVVMKDADESSMILNKEDSNDTKDGKNS